MLKQNLKAKNWFNLLLFVVPYFFVVGFFQFIGAFICGVDLTIENIHETIEQQVIIASFGFVGTFLVIFLFMKWIDKEPFLNLGFRYQNNLKDIAIGVVIGLAIMGFGYGILVFFNQIKFTEITFSKNEFLLTFILFLLVAIMEETLLRGYVLRSLLNSFNKDVALIISAILFSLMHVANPHITWISHINLFLSGILLGLSYVYTRNLWFPIALHFSWNFFQSLFGFNVSGQDSYSLIEFKIVKNNTLNGGSFGMEGSILTIIFQIILIFLIFSFFNQTKREKQKTPPFC